MKFSKSAVLVPAVAALLSAAIVLAGGGRRGGGPPPLLPNGTATDPVVPVDPRTADPLDQLLNHNYLPAPVGALPIKESNITGVDGAGRLAYAPPQTQPFAQQQDRYWTLALQADPAQMKTFRAKNAQLGPPKDGEDRVVFIGDSITENWQGQFNRNFPGKTNYIGRGISSQTSMQMLVRFRPDVIDLLPKVVVILAGINDIAGNTGIVPDETLHGYFASMIDIAKANNVKVVLISTLPGTNFFWMPSVDPKDRVQKLADWQKEYAKKAGIYLVDGFYAFKDPNSLGMKQGMSSDSVHPTAQGYQLLSGLVQTQIDHALKGDAPEYPKDDATPKP